MQTFTQSFMSIKISILGKPLDTNNKLNAVSLNYQGRSCAQ